MSPGKMVFGVSPSENGNWYKFLSQEKKFIFILRLFICLPLCRARRLSLVGWLPCWERASYSALQEWCYVKGFVMLYIFSMLALQI